MSNIFPLILDPLGIGDYLSENMLSSSEWAEFDQDNFMGLGRSKKVNVFAIDYVLSVACHFRYQM